MSERMLRASLLVLSLEKYGIDVLWVSVESDGNTINVQVFGQSDLLGWAEAEGLTAIEEPFDVSSGLKMRKVEVAEYAYIYQLV